jgi:butyryl-CoA:acetate CoA-transferase
MSWNEEYRRKLTTAEEAVQVIKSGDWVDLGFGHTKPIALDAALAARKNVLENINIHCGLSLSPHACVETDPEGKVFTYQSWHFTGLDRKLHDRGRCYYNPMIFRNQGLLYRKSISGLVDVAMLRVTKMDDNGFCNLHCGVAAVRDMVELARHVVLEVNENLPWAMGGRQEVLHISEVDAIVEHNSPVEVVPPAPPSELDKIIAGHIVPFIPDGACLQLGIGGLPNSVGTVLAESDIKDVGCHTEMLVDAYHELHKAGKLTNRKKVIDRGKSVYAFAVGSESLYDWINYNPALAAFPVSYTNDPNVMAENPNMISINACVEVDLYGQVSSESSGSRHISGTGGQLDFATGAYMSEGGISFICCNSSFTDKEGHIKSNIVPTLPAGSIVTVPRTQAHMIVTEYGIADLAGLSTWQRAEALVEIAHPDLRDDLIEAAEEQHIWRRSNKVA